MPPNGWHANGWHGGGGPWRVGLEPDTGGVVGSTRPCTQATRNGMAGHPAAPAPAGAGPRPKAGHG